MGAAKHPAAAPVNPRRAGLTDEPDRSGAERRHIGLAYDLGALCQTRLPPFCAPSTRPGGNEHQPDRAPPPPRRPGDLDAPRQAEEPAGMAEGTFRPPRDPDGQPMLLVDSGAAIAAMNAGAAAKAETR